MISNELLEDYADTFLTLRIRELIGITFGQFLTQPDYHVTKASALLTGDGLHEETIVELNT